MLLHSVCGRHVEGIRRAWKKAEGLRQSSIVGKTIRICLKTGRAAYNCPRWWMGREGMSAMLASEFTHSTQQSISRAAMARWKRLPISAIGFDAENPLIMQDHAGVLSTKKYTRLPRSRYLKVSSKHRAARSSREQMEL